MLTARKVDGNTRIILTQGRWEFSVLEKLAKPGNEVQDTDQEPHLRVRDEAKVNRMDAHLDAAVPLEGQSEKTKGL